jgi:hypothetical protein
LPSSAPDVRFWQILLQKYFWGREQKFLRLLMRFARGRCEEPYRSIQNRSRTSASALKSDAAAEKPKDQLWRDFSGCSIFDFCNKIGTKRTNRSGDWAKSEIVVQGRQGSF